MAVLQGGMGRDPLEHQARRIDRQADGGIGAGRARNEPDDVYTKQRRRAQERDQEGGSGGILNVFLT